MKKKHDSTWDRFKQHYKYLPALPGEVVFRVQYNDSAECFEIKECRVTKLILADTGTTIVSSPVHTLLHIIYEETVDDFLANTELTFDAAKIRIDSLNKR